MIGRGQEPSLAAMLAGLTGVASLPGRILFNVVSDRFSPQLLLALSQAVLGLGMAMLMLSSSTVGIIAAVLVYGSVFGSTLALVASVRAEHFGRRAYGTISAVQGIPALGGAALGPLLAGWIYDHLGGYEVAFAAVVALYLASTVAMLLTPRARDFANG
jgi:MFS family permease